MEYSRPIIGTEFGMVATFAFAYAVALMLATRTYGVADRDAAHAGIYEVDDNGGNTQMALLSNPRG